MAQRQRGLVWVTRGIEAHRLVQFLGLLRNSSGSLSPARAVRRVCVGFIMVTFWSWMVNAKMNLFTGRVLLWETDECNLSVCRTTRHRLPFGGCFCEEGSIPSCGACFRPQGFRVTLGTAGRITHRTRSLSGSQCFLRTRCFRGFAGVNYRPREGTAKRTPNTCWTMSYVSACWSQLRLVGSDACMKFLPNCTLWLYRAEQT